MTTPHFLPTPSQLISVEERSVSNPDNPDYFIQTDPRFTNYKNFISSDYMLNQLSLDPTTLHKRLGDGYYEQKLIREQIMSLTGKRFLEGFNSDEEQYMALLNSGVEYMKSFDISVGIALSSEQMKNLTTDIVLLVQKEVTLNDGTKTTALVPQLYTAASKVNTNGSLISASNIVTNGSNDLVNSGTIMATNAVILNSTSSINNNAGNVSGDYVVLNAGKDININGGNIEANSAMALNAANNVNISSTTYSTTDTDGISDFSKTGIQSTANIKVNNSDGYVSISEGIQWAKEHPNLDNDYTESNGLGNATPWDTLYIDASKLDFGRTTIDDLFLGKNGYTVNLLSYTDFLSQASVATTYALGRVDVNIVDKNKGIISIINNNGTIYNWDKGGGNLRSTLINLERFRAGVNDTNGFPLWIYGTVTLDKPKIKVQEVPPYVFAP